MKSNNIEVITLGCSKNTVDSERLITQLKANKLKVVETSDQADAIIINTCGFIEAAKEESINTILEAVELKKKGKVKKVIVAGCLSARYKEELAKEIPGVDAFHGSEAYEGILNDFGVDLKKELLGERFISTPKHFAYLKISEGCDNPCSFCAIPIMRGGHKSKSIENLVDETKRLADKGVRELVIIGQDTTDYGKDIYNSRELGKLLNELSKVNGIEWLRLLYAYPSHFPLSAMEEIAGNPKVLNYIDMPLQHISDKVLKSMQRGITKRRTIEIIDQLRSTIPNLTLRSTLITGYPTEGEAEYNELVKFVEETRFDRLGVFNYSIEDGTKCFDLGDVIPEEVKEERSANIMEIQKGISLEKNEEFVGKKLQVIVDDIQDDYYVCRSYRDAPEVDGEVFVKPENKLLKIGDFYDIEIIDYNEYDLYAKIL